MSQTAHFAAHIELATGLFRDLLSSERRAARALYTAFYRELWISAATDVGATVSELSDGTLEIGLGTGRVRVRNTHCSIDGREVIDRSRNKALVCRMLTKAGLPVPAHKVFSLATLGAAQGFLAAAQSPCVVKPARDTGAGQGVTTGVRMPVDLQRAAVAAAAAGARGGRKGRSGALASRLVGMLRSLSTVPLLVEHQVSGANYRLLYLDGMLLDAIRRDPPTVTGDGRSSVKALIDRVNSERLRSGGLHGQRLITRDLDLARTLAAQGLHETTVPAAGLVVRLKTTINENSPDRNHPARHELCEEIIEDGRRAAALVGARLAGVDILTLDPSVPLAKSGGCLLEVNTTPGLAMHHHSHPGQVAPAIALLRQLATRS
ncbi:hypothetical protein ACVGVM_21085 [Pseudonocardia bannensis]|uniref:ATP-grasp domain-containing protein n=1 Tax=Pseudonocardia bannensis TaxID=630973 RepID=A0A848DET9_9PSEU|nr:hypothetical protein [Pseudonocardia bannensis]NMH91140.1 hypothetical protein [Pseudonocardia bannensis]